MNRTLFFHSQPNSKLRRYTTAGVVVEYGNQKRLNIGVSIVSGQDMFSKKIGRKISEARAIEKPILSLDIKGEEKFINKFIEVSESLLNNKEYRNLFTKSKGEK